MQPGTYSLERSLEDCVNHAIQKAVKNPCGIDPFGSELRAAMDTFASSLPSCLQKDRITTRETLPASRKVTVTSVSNEDQNKKSSHPLISSVNQGVLVLNQPIFYTVKKGDTLSEISWKLTGRKSSVRDLKNWNTIWDDKIKPGQVLYLADPYDTLVKEIASKLSKHELTGRNPKISLDRLSEEMVAKHGGLFREQYDLEIQLEYTEPVERLISSIIIGAQAKQVNHWAPEPMKGSKYGINKRLGNQSFDYERPHMGADSPGWTDWLGLGMDASDDVLNKVGESFNKYQLESNTNRWGLDYSKEIGKVNTGTTIIKWGGRLVAVYNAHDINKKHKAGEISKVQMVLEQSSNAFSTFGGVVGAAWGVGWETGRAITTIPLYQQWKLEVWYPWRKEKLDY